MRLGIQISGRCNARCGHCSDSCGPHRRTLLTTDQVIEVMNQAAAIRDGTPLEFSLTGGEPFLDTEQLRLLIAHGTKLGAAVSCMSNAFWASSPQKAAAVLRPLYDAGLRSIGISTSRFHEAFVPATSVRNALTASRKLGIETTLKRALVKSDVGPSGIDDRAGLATLADVVENFAVVGPGRVDGSAVSCIDAEELFTSTGIPNGTCPSESMMVSDDGSLLACCSSARVGPMHTLGNALNGQLRKSIERSHLDGTHQLLRRHGPSHFIETFRTLGLEVRLHDQYHDVCDLCSHIASDPFLAAAAQQVGRRFAEQSLAKRSEALAKELFVIEIH